MVNVQLTSFPLVENPLSEEVVHTSPEPEGVDVGAAVGGKGVLVGIGVEVGRVVGVEVRGVLVVDGGDTPGVGVRVGSPPTVGDGAGTSVAAGVAEWEGPGPMSRSGVAVPA